MNVYININLYIPTNKQTNFKKMAITKYFCVKQKMCKFKSQRPNTNHVLLAMNVQYMT